MGREYFSAYHSYLEAMEELTDAEKGRLFTACLTYSKTGEAPQLSGNERYLFPAFRSQIDRDNAEYAKKCATNRRNGGLGGKRTGANGSDRPPNAPQEKEKGKEEDKEEGESIRTVSNETVCWTDVQRVVDAWNNLGLQTVKKIAKETTRYKFLRKRIVDYGIDDVLRAIHNVGESDFLMGKSDSKNPFQATFDWFLKPNNFPKVLDGNYANRTAPRTEQRPPGRKTFAEIAEEMEGKL